MAKNKQQKEKERERRVAQKKHAASQKQDQDQTASENSKADRKTNIFTASLSWPSRFPRLWAASTPTRAGPALERIKPHAVGQETHFLGSGQSTRPIQLVGELVG
jgi:hypothetical protein